MIFAIEDIRAGDEIAVEYCPKDFTLAKRKEACKQFGFKCTCRLCEFQRNTTAENIQLRGQLMNEFMEEIIPQLQRSLINGLETVRLFLDMLNATYAADSPYQFERSKSCTFLV